MKCISERPLSPVFSISFVVIFGGLVVFGHRESVGKLKKKLIQNQNTFYHFLSDQIGILDKCTAIGESNF